MFIFSAIIISCYLFALYYFRCRKKNQNGQVRTLVVIGSGGHTSEMLHLLSCVSNHYNPRLYLMADSDTTSRAKILEAETKLKSDYEIVKVPRSRSVGQSYITSVFTTIYAAVACLRYVANFVPDLVLCNGPGTCVPICFIVYIFKKCFWWRTKIIFVESICRVRSLSLSGRILLYLADFVLVQWPELQEKYPQTVYIGRFY